MRTRYLAAPFTTTLLLLGLSIGAQAQVVVTEMTEEEADALIAEMEASMAGGTGIEIEDATPPFDRRLV